MTALRLDRNFPDPCVVADDDGRFHAYATNGEGLTVPTASAPSPEGPWDWTGVDALPEPPAWSDAHHWAPDVSRLPDGTWLMYVTARHAGSGRQAVGVATAPHPLGPFTPVGDEPLIHPVEQGGAIDASAFVDTDGTRYVVWKNDGNAVGLPTRLHLQRTTPDGQALAGGPQVLLENDRPEEAGVVEAPCLVHRGGRYVLFYAAGPFTEDTYREHYATAPALTGPWTKAPGDWLTTASTGGAVTGPGAMGLLSTPGGDVAYFHGWRPPGGRGHRAMYSARLEWTADGTPVLR